MIWVANIVAERVRQQEYQFALASGCSMLDALHAAWAAYNDVIAISLIEPAFRSKPHPSSSLAGARAAESSPRLGRNYSLASNECAPRLLACPFCGGDAELLHGEATDQVWAHGKFSRVFCTKCQCRQLFHRTDEAAIAAWNKRPAEGQS